jgi:protein-disulfide isomerase
MDRSRILGDSTAPVWMVMVSDFQCPFCKRFHDQTFPTIEQRYIKTGKVRFAFLNFPLPSHANAWPAAEAAMCAGIQGKFWPYQDVLYNNQDSWAEKHPPTHVLDSLAHSIAIDTAALHRCVAQHQAKPLIQADQDRAEQAERALIPSNPELAQQVGSTPAFIIGSRTLIIGAQPLETFTHALDSALAAGR